MNGFKKFLMCLTLVLGQQVLALEDLGVFRDWTAHSGLEGGKKVCFAATPAKELLAGETDHSFLYLTHRPAEGVRNEMSLVTTFNFAPDLIAHVEIGDQRFEIFATGNQAWIIDASQEDRLARAIRAGSDLKLEATNDKGEQVELTFSLRGSTAAAEAISDCQAD